MPDSPDEREQKPAQATTGGWEGMSLKGMPAPERAALVVTQLTLAYRQEGLLEPPAVAVACGIVERAILGAEADARHKGREAMREAAAQDMNRQGFDWVAREIRALKVEDGDA